jgi:phosphatidylserine decarboxylase
MGQERAGGMRFSTSYLLILIPSKERTNNMALHREGTKIIVGSLLLALGISFLAWSYLPVSLALMGCLLSFVLLGLVVQFFRNPHRDILLEEGTVLAPADGKIVVIEETNEIEYLKDRRIQVSIFMSPLNVHVNRNPVSGKINYLRYHPGKYLVAWHPKSSLENERTTLVICTENGQQVLLRQIAGALARRIRWYVKEGEEVMQGAEFGFITFGSRVDVFLPLGSKIEVTAGTVTKGGLTVLARLLPEKDILSA